MARRHLQEIETLDPVRDHCRIVFLIATCEFPFDVAHSLEFALFRTYAIPRISALLRSTGELTERTLKRYDDTDLLLSELIEHGYNSKRGRAALANINHQHARYPIRNEDYLYVLSTFIFEPIRWINRFGYRPMSEKEQLAWFVFWCAIGERMSIRDIPPHQEAFDTFNRTYEEQCFRFSQSNRDVADRTTDLLLGFYLPQPLFRLGRPMVHALLDPRLLTALHLPPSPAWRRQLLCRTLRLRARVARFLPGLRRPLLRTNIRRQTYPDGYQVEDLGPQ